MKRPLITLLLSLLVSAAAGQVLVDRDPRIAQAVAAICVDSLQATITDLVGFHTRHNLSSRTDPTRGIGAAAQYLYDKASRHIPASQDRLSVEKMYYTAGGPQTRLGREVELCNVVATLQGSDPDRPMILLLAHYDSRVDHDHDSTSQAPGANDNGSGVAALMEIVRLASRIPTSATLKIAFLSGEEHGLLGAAHMAALARQQQWNIIAVLNNDMIGNADASQTGLHNNSVVRLFSENIPAIEDQRAARLRAYNSAENDSPSRQLARYIKQVGERYVDQLEVRLIYRNDRFGRGGDHTPFSQQGFTAVRITEYGENYDRTHQLVRRQNGIAYGDMIGGVDFQYVRKNAGINLASALNLAMAPQAPRQVRVDISALSNYTDLSWEAPQGNAPAGYRVLIRQTDRSMWQQAIVVSEPRVRLPLSRDNYFFAVQSVDAAGHESLAVPAVAGR